MDTLKSRLKFARKEREMTQEQLAERSGLTQPDISKIERGLILKPSGLLALARALRCNPDWLDTGDGRWDVIGAAIGWMEHDDVLTSGPDLKGTVPLISEVQAGNWKEAIDNLHPGEGERIHTTYRVRKHTYALRVTNDSMEPKFPDGAIIIVEPEEHAQPGKFVVVRRGDGKATLKQLVQDGDTLFLKPLNPRYPIMEITPDTVFCGVVKRVEFDV